MIGGNGCRVTVEQMHGVVFSDGQQGNDGHTDYQLRQAQQQFDQLPRDLALVRLPEEVAGQRDQCVAQQPEKQSVHSDQNHGGDEQRQIAVQMRDQRRDLLMPELAQGIEAEQ